MHENGGEEALRKISKRKPIIKNRLPEHVENAVVALAIENPALGQLRAWQELWPGHSIQPTSWLGDLGNFFGRGAPRTPQQTARGTGISLLAALAGVNPLASLVGGGLNAIYNGFQNTDDDDMEQSGWEYVRQRKLESKPQQQKARDDLKGRNARPQPRLQVPTLPTATQQGATTTRTDNAQDRSLAWLYPLLRTRAYDPGTYQKILQGSWGLRSKQRPGFRLTADR